ncbi:MAG: sulfite exporter TauE/SafE family protein [Alphaproteobacteria bacterium]|nr:sulfite exporter TauE/SafE family protein [Alphaproteobacteria bacterium]
MIEILILCAAGFAAGALNAVAGGGTFLSLPALIYVGVPPVTANATATVTALPGYIASAWGFREDIRSEGALGLRAILTVTVLGSIAGSFLLIATPGDAFLDIVPWLLLLATLLFATGPAMIGQFRKRSVASAGRLVSGVTVLAVAIYGGYFNGGLGIMLLAVFGLIGFTDLHGMNGLKNILSALLSLVSAVTLAAAGLVAWEHAVLMALCATVGGYLGARLSRRIVRTDLLRIFVTVVGLFMTVMFFTA